MKVGKLKVSEKVTDAAAVAGIGALAGLAGTVAMKVTSSVGAKIGHRGMCEVPVETAGGLPGIDADNPSTKTWFNLRSAGWLTSSA